MLVARKRRSIRYLLRWAGGVACIAVPFVGLRYLYFGEWLPNTYFAKVGAPLGSRLIAGFSYSLDFFDSMLSGRAASPLLVSWVGLGSAAALVLFGLRRARIRCWALLVVFTGLAVLFAGGDWMVLSRLWIPALPFLLMLLGWFIDGQVRRGGLRRLLAAAGSVLLGLNWVAWGITERTRDEGLLSPRRPRFEEYHELSSYLASRARVDDTIALMDIGQIGYETGLRIIDITGLVTPWVAKSPGEFLNKQYPVERLLAENPRFVLLRPEFPIDRRIEGSPQFRERYRPVLRKVLSDVLDVYERVEARPSP